MQLKSLFMCLLIAIPMGVSAQIGEGDNQPYVSSDTVYDQSISQLHQLLQARGYQIISITPTQHRGRPILVVEALKNGQTYHIRLTYPSLKIISEIRKD